MQFWLFQASRRQVGKLEHHEGAVRAAVGKGLVRLLEWRDVDGQADAHEEACEGLRKVFAIGRQQAKPTSVEERPLAQESQGQ